MRKMKKINGFLVVRFNDREKRNNPTLGSFGVIDAEQYTGDLDFDLDAVEYTDADLIEIAVEQARGLDAEEDFGEEPTTYTVIAETAAEAREEDRSGGAVSVTITGNEFNVRGESDVDDIAEKIARKLQDALLRGG